MFEMWITCSEKEAKWKLNNPDLTELGKKHTHTHTHTLLNKWDPLAISAAHSVVKQKKRITKLVNTFFPNYMKKFARFGKRSQKKLLLMQENLVKNE